MNWMMRLGGEQRPWMRHPLLHKALVVVACTLVLLGVLSLYLQPDFLVTLADQMWGCF